MEDECPVADGGNSPRRTLRQASSVSMGSDSSCNIPLTKISIHAGSLKRVRDINSRGTRRNRRRKTSTIILRHKYILVVGSILLINILFIVPYSTIQILQLQYSKSHSSLANAYKWARQKWIFQAMIGLHSVLKPLCYFRMQEFRKWAKCNK
uniref:G-protein coupled receptors family 1 profile domain-containing protein n=1 Tax=Romanomermis culicivorax TaxID=13658 RepID=A0A915IBG4_ROMCU